MPQSRSFQAAVMGISASIFVGLLLAIAGDIPLRWLAAFVVALSFPFALATYQMITSDGSVLESRPNKVLVVIQWVSPIVILIAPPNIMRLLALLASIVAGVMIVAARPR